MRIQQIYRSFIGIAISVCISLPAFSAGFQISETSVTGLGRGFAGQGVAGDSISEMTANPAALGLHFDTEFEIGIHVIVPSASFKNRGSSQTLLMPGGPVTIPASGPNSDGRENALVPNLYLSGAINDRMRYGIGITAPYGLTTEYDSNWVGRYAAIKSELETVDINPALTYKVNNITIGAGLSIVKADAELTRALFTGPGSPDGLVKVEGDDTAIGWNVGAVGEDEVGRFGIGFRSRVSLDFEGDLEISPLGVTAGTKADLVLPKTVYLSGLLKKNPQLDLLASARWTDWTSFEELRFRFNNGFPDSITPENWSSSTTISVGFNYRKSDAWTYRGGLVYDESPVSDEFRTARISDADRIWVTFGGSYNVSKRVRVDFGYAHIFADNANLSESTNLVATAPGAATDNLNGRYTDTDVDILSVAVAVKLGKN